MSVNSKSKGNTWEREIANLFSEQFNDTFKRVPQSGALVGGFNRKVINEGLRSDAVEILAGDVITPKGFPFSLECKFYKDFAFHQLLSSENKVLDGWIEQAEDDAKVSNKEFLLLMKFNRKGSYVCSSDHSVNEGESCITGIIDDYIVYKKKYIMYSLETFLGIKERINLIHTWITYK